MISTLPEAYCFRFSCFRLNTRNKCFCCAEIDAYGVHVGVSICQLFMWRYITLSYALIIRKKSRQCKHRRDFFLHFSMEARGVEPLSWTLLTQASPCSDADCCSHRWSALRRPSTKPGTCGCHTVRGSPARHLPTELGFAALVGIRR